MWQKTFEKTLKNNLLIDQLKIDEEAKLNEWVKFFISEKIEDYWDDLRRIKILNTSLEKQSIFKTTLT